MDLGRWWGWFCFIKSPKVARRKVPIFSKKGLFRHLQARLQGAISTEMLWVFLVLQRSACRLPGLIGMPNPLHSDGLVDYEAGEGYAITAIMVQPWYNHGTIRPMTFATRHGYHSRLSSSCRMELLVPSLKWPRMCSPRERFTEWVRCKWSSDPNFKILVPRVYVWHCLAIWKFPQIEVPPVIIHFHGIFPNKNHPAIGVPPWRAGNFDEVANFLCWAAEPAHDERKLIGLKVRFGIEAAFQWMKVGIEIGIFGMMRNGDNLWDYYPKDISLRSGSVWLCVWNLSMRDRQFRLAPWEPSLLASGTEACGSGAPCLVLQDPSGSGSSHRYLWLFRTFADLPISQNDEWSGQQNRYKISHLRLETCYTCVSSVWSRLRICHMWISVKWQTESDSGHLPWPFPDIQIFVTTV